MRWSPLLVASLFLTVAVPLGAGADGGASSSCAGGDPLASDPTLDTVPPTRRYVFAGPEPVVRVRLLAGEVGVRLEAPNADGDCQAICDSSLTTLAVPMNTVWACPRRGQTVFLEVSGTGAYRIEPGF